MIRENVLVMKDKNQLKINLEKLFIYTKLRKKKNCARKRDHGGLFLRRCIFEGQNGGIEANVIGNDSSVSSRDCSQRNPRHLS